MTLTVEQEKAVFDRGHNLLVSAAAGSGKTRVLVNRILSRITSMDELCDVDRFLVMTFTRAAALEMKKRIESGLFEALDKAREEGNRMLADHLRRQTGLIRGAYISTIDGFCTTVLRNHFNATGMDPSFRVGGAAELILLRQEVMDEVLEAEYETGEQAFTDFIEAFSKKNSDRNVVEMILTLYDYSRSKPDPAAWLDDSAFMYEAGEQDALFDTPVVSAFYATAHSRLRQALRYSDEACELAQSPGGPESYVPVLDEENEALSEVLTAASSGAGYDRIRTLLMSIEYKRLPSRRGEEVDPDIKEAVKGYRETYKKLIADLIKKYYPVTAKVLLDDVRAAAPHVRTLTGLVKKFAKAFGEAKSERRIVDFADLEHFTLDVLYERDKEGRRMGVLSPAAKEYREHFLEIYVDEYQDSNEVQEEILKAVSREDETGGNLFMVGDVKQSIYRFRLATPSLFARKSEEYHPVKCDGDDEVYKNGRIDLSMNFRSRKEILDVTNCFFGSLMKKAVGNVEYDERARLVYGELYNGGERDTYIPELMLIDEDEDISRGEMEGSAIADRIEELMRTFKVSDPGGEPRPLKYSDIAILSRSIGDTESEIRDVLSSRGIPVYAPARSGYFEGYEIRTMLDLLTVIDNPRNDEKLCAVLKGYFGGLSDEELARIRIAFPSGNYYMAVLRYAGDGDKADPLGIYSGASQEEGEEENVKDVDRGLQDKLHKILEFIRKYEKKSRYMTVRELISALIEEKGFGLSVLAMDRGNIRRQNLDLLTERAAEYENSSYKGLFNFIKYIEQLQFYDEDFGQSQAVSENDNVVRMMTIHKSKGLEFPVCFLIRLGKKFNKTDVTGDLIMDADNGIGVNLIDTRARVKSTTVIKRALENHILRESAGEELRVLYVAMTRAKEKLIMSTTIDNSVKKNIRFYNTMQGSPADSDGNKKANPGLSPESITDSRSYLEWIIKVLCTDSGLNRPIESMMDDECPQNMVNAGDIPLKITLIKSEDLVIKQLDTDVSANESKIAFLDILQKTSDISNREGLDLNSETNIKSGYENNGSSGNEGSEGDINDIFVPMKVSVSKLKHMEKEEKDWLQLVEEKGDYVNQEENYADSNNMRNDKADSNMERPGEIDNACADKEEEQGQPYINNGTKEKPVPLFIRKQRGEDTGQGPLIGSLRGSAYHRFFELLDYSGDLSAEGLKKQIASFRERGFLDEKQARVLSVKDYIRFAESSLGRRMKDACEKGLLKREQPFCIAVPADSIDERYPAGETVLVQGIIDALFLEKGEYVIVDYKTDNVKELSRLTELYSLQLRYYSRAVEQITGIRVKELWLYSVKLGDAVMVEREDAQGVCKGE